nr:hypothetical protein [Tanacetum cinerariifolium]
MACIEEIAKDAKLIRIKDQLLVLIKRQVETELMLEEKFRDLCEEVSNFVKESEDVPRTQDRRCRYFMWKDDLIRRLSFSLGPSTPPSSSLGPSTRLCYSPLRSTLNLGKAECSNCNFFAEKIKALETKIKILEGTLEMERHPENHTLELATILHELYNNIGKLSLD